jgi:hypothetical protein
VTSLRAEVAGAAPTGLFERLLDDAALFPPGDATMPDAVRAHRAYRRFTHHELLGLFICRVDRSGELNEQAARAGIGIDASVVVPIGVDPGRLPVHLRDLHSVNVRALELTLAPGPDLLAGLDRIAELAPAIDVYIELPSTAITPANLLALAQRSLLSKFRTGGLVAGAFPDEGDLAAAITAAVEAGVAFKTTAGLHNAIRHSDPSSGFEHHGFLNVVLATAEAAAGRPQTDVTSVLAQRDGAALAARVRELEGADIVAARSCFRSFGTCSVLDPLADLRDLGLL